MLPGGGITRRITRRKGVGKRRPLIQCYRIPNKNRRSAQSPTSNDRLGSPTQEKKNHRQTKVIASYGEVTKCSSLVQQDSSPYLRGTCLHVDRRQAHHRVHLHPNNKYNQGLCMHDAGHPVLRPFNDAPQLRRTVVAHSNSDSVNALSLTLTLFSFFGAVGLVAGQPYNPAVQ